MEQHTNRRLGRLKRMRWLRPSVLYRFLRVELMRTLPRRTEFGLSLAGALVGIAAGLSVAGMTLIAQTMHASIFGLEADERLSGAAVDEKMLLLLAPISGGILLGIILFVLTRWRKRPLVDPIEANALHGGRLSLTDSVVVAVQNLISNGFGASVGLEAGYTQVAAGLASKFGSKLKLRRSDMRILVGCGAAGAISAAFNAPLTGAFYAFELIIGAYTIISLTPVVVSALSANLVARLLAASDAGIDVGTVGTIVPADYVPALLLGAICGAAGILLMQGVALVEEMARKSFLPPYLRPAVGGAIVGALAMVSPQILSGGHGALHVNLETDATMAGLLGLFLLKASASAISIGSGFRGGLFFASLLMGALLGKLFAFGAPYLGHATLAPASYAVVGMSSLAVAVIGGPLTMTFLALEVTGDFPMTVLVLASVITSSFIVRTLFGYSFATWRFHLRGETIRSAHDVGWIRNLTVDKLMRADVRTADAKMALDEFRKHFPLGSTQRVILVDESGKYAGMVSVPEAHGNLVDVETEPAPVCNIAKHPHDVLLPTLNAKQAAILFDETESEALAVVGDMIEQKVIGLLTGSHTLRRYSEELDRHRREISGEL
jgi:CIC family chloride channel protein